MLDKKHFEEQWASNEEKLIRKAMFPFPEYFGLRAFPGKVFTIMESACYVSGGQVYLYVFVKNANGWESFCKGTQGELLHQITLYPEVV